MSERTRNGGGRRITISPDEPDLSRSWPDPLAAFREESGRGCIADRARLGPGSITPDELAFLVSVASAYAHIFEISQRELLPTHAAIRAHLRNTR